MSDSDKDPFFPEYKAKRYNLLANREFLSAKPNEEVQRYLRKQKEDEAALKSKKQAEEPPLNLVMPVPMPLTAPPPPAASQATAANPTPVFIPAEPLFPPPPAPQPAAPSVAPAATPAVAPAASVPAPTSSPEPSWETLTKAFGTCNVGTAGLAAPAPLEVKIGGAVEKLERRANDNDEDGDDDDYEDDDDDAELDEDEERELAELEEEERRLDERRKRRERGDDDGLDRKHRKRSPDPEPEPSDDGEDDETDPEDDDDADADEEKQERKGGRHVAAAAAAVPAITAKEIAAAFLEVLKTQPGLAALGSSSAAVAASVRNEAPVARCKCGNANCCGGGGAAAADIDALTTEFLLGKGGDIGLNGRRKVDTGTRRAILLRAVDRMQKAMNKDDDLEAVSARDALADIKERFERMGGCERDVEDSDLTVMRKEAAIFDQQHANDVANGSSDIENMAFISTCGIEAVAKIAAPLLGVKNPFGNASVTNKMNSYLQQPRTKRLLERYVMRHGSATTDHSELKSLLLGGFRVLAESAGKSAFFASSASAEDFICRKERVASKAAPAPVAPLPSQVPACSKATKAPAPAKTVTPPTAVAPSKGAGLGASVPASLAEQLANAPPLAIQDPNTKSKFPSLNLPNYNALTNASKTIDLGGVVGTMKSALSRQQESAKVQGKRLEALERAAKAAEDAARADMRAAISASS